MPGRWQFFAIAIIIALGFIGNMVQSNTIAVAFNSAFSLPKWLVGCVVAILAFMVFIGGMGRIAGLTEKLVPAMAALYIVGGTYILVVHGGAICSALAEIVRSAFTPSAIYGGAIGITIREAMRYGVARGLFANEAGMGSTPMPMQWPRCSTPAIRVWWPSLACSQRLSS